MGCNKFYDWLLVQKFAASIMFCFACLRNFYCTLWCSSCPEHLFRLSVDEIVTSRSFYLQTTASQSALFDHLINIWQFNPGPVPGTCNLYFWVDFKFQSPFYRQVCFLYGVNYSWQDWNYMWNFGGVYLLIGLNYVHKIWVWYLVSFHGCSW